MTYALADIHGEYDKLCSLLDILSRDADKYIFLGDYIDKGKYSREVIKLLLDIAREKECVFLLGDHEYAWNKYLNGEQRYREFLLKYGGRETLSSYSGKNLSLSEAERLLTDRDSARDVFKEHGSFFYELKMWHEEDNYFCVHAGIEPCNKQVPITQHNVERLVFVRHEFIDSRFLFEGKRVIFGHTVFDNPYIDEYKVGIDTGAVYAPDNQLTAFNLEEGFFVQKSKGRFLPYAT